MIKIILIIKSILLEMHLSITEENVKNNSQFPVAITFY